MATTKINFSHITIRKQCHNHVAWSLYIYRKQVRDVSIVELVYSYNYDYDIALQCDL